MLFDLHLQTGHYIARNKERSHVALCRTFRHSRNLGASDVEFSDGAERERRIFGTSQDSMGSTTDTSGTTSRQRATGNCGVICTGPGRGSARELFDVIEDGSRDGNSDIVPDLSKCMIIGDERTDYTLFGPQLKGVERPKKGRAPEELWES